jgi:hypothetical protein
LEEVTCSGDREFKVKGKKKEERALLEGVGEGVVEAMVDCFNRYKE